MCHFLHPINILAVRPRTYERIARPFHLFLPLSLKVLSLVASLIFHPRLKLFLSCGCEIDLLLKIIYIYIFFFLIRFYTGYTLLPNNTINRCFLPLLLPRPPLPIWTREDLARKWPSITAFALVPSVFFGKSPPLVVPPWDPEGPRSLRFVSHYILAAGGKDIRATSSREITNVISTTLPSSLSILLLFSTLVLSIYVYLVAKNIREW